MRFHSLRLLACTVLTLAIATTVGCAWRFAYQRAEEHASHRRWHSAIDECLEALRKKPDYTEAQALLEEVSKKAFDRHVRNINSYLGRDNWDMALDEYYQLRGFKQKLSEVSLTAPALIEQLQRRGAVPHGFLGAFVQRITPAIAKIKGFSSTEGIFVAQLVPGSPAEKGGLREADLIISLGGKEIKTPNQFVSSVAGHFPCEQVKIGIIRGGRTKILALTLGSRTEYLKQVPLTFDQILPFDKVLQEQNRVREQAFEIHFNKGKSLLEKGLNRQAAEELKRALRLKPDDVKIRRAYEEAKEKALIRIAVPRFENLTQYSGLENLLTSEILSEVMTRKPDFIDFINEEEFDEILKRYQLSLSDLYESSLELGNLGVVNVLFTGSILKVNRPDKEYSEGIKVEEWWYRKDPETGEKHYFTKEKPAMVFTESRTVTLSISFKVTDVTTGRIVISRTVDKSAKDETKWTDYEGGIKRKDDSYYPIGEGAPPGISVGGIEISLGFGEEEIPSKRSPVASFDSLTKQVLKACAKEIAEEVISYYR
ncbi:MAG: PDZ domain-containing protein [Candidatus Latescibacteria bacterium]|nr:PDZ domain-containing protein [Candidatus Latescibacterota bacterium]